MSCVGGNDSAVCDVVCAYPWTNVGIFAPYSLVCDINGQARMALTIIASVFWITAFLLGIRAWAVLKRPSEAMLQLERNKLFLFVWGSGWFLAWHLLELIGLYYLGVHWEAGMGFFIASVSMFYFFMIHYPGTKAGDSLLPFAIERLPTHRRRMTVLNLFKFVYVSYCTLFATPLIMATNLPPFQVDYAMFLTVGYSLANFLFILQSFIYQYLLWVIVHHVSFLMEEHKRHSHDVDRFIQDKRLSIETMFRRSQLIRKVLAGAFIIFVPCLTLMARYPTSSVGRQVNAYFFPVASVVVCFLVIRNAIISYTLSKRIASRQSPNGFMNTPGHTSSKDNQTNAQGAGGLTPQMNLVMSSDGGGVQDDLTVVDPSSSPSGNPGALGMSSDGYIATASPQLLQTPPSPAHVPPSPSSTSGVSHLFKGILGKKKKNRFFTQPIDEMPKLTEERPSLLSTSEKAHMSKSYSWIWGGDGASSPAMKHSQKHFLSGSSDMVGSSDGQNTAYFDEKTKLWKFGKKGLTVEQHILTGKSNQRLNKTIDEEE